MPVGIAAQRAGMSAHMVRHYESLGLLPRDGHRQLTTASTRAEVHARHPPCAPIWFSPWPRSPPSRPVAEDKARAAPGQSIAQAHIDDLATRIAAMQAMQRTLQSLMQVLPRRRPPDCPILDDLAAVGGIGQTEMRQRLSVLPRSQKNLLKIYPGQRAPCARGRLQNTPQPHTLYSSPVTCATKSIKSNAFWSGGIANPIEVIEQITYLLFLRAPSTAIRKTTVLRLKKSSRCASSPARRRDTQDRPTRRHALVLLQNMAPAGCSMCPAPGLPLPARPG